MYLLGVLSATGVLLLLGSTQVTEMYVCVLANVYTYTDNINSICNCICFILNKSSYKYKFFYIFIFICKCIYISSFTYKHKFILTPSALIHYRTNLYSFLFFFICNFHFNREKPGFYHPPCIFLSVCILLFTYSCFRIVHL